MSTKGSGRVQASTEDSFCRLLLSSVEDSYTVQCFVGAERTAWRPKVAQSPVFLMAASDWLLRWVAPPTGRAGGFQVSSQAGVP